MAQKNPFGSPPVDRMTLSQNGIGSIVEKKNASLLEGSKSVANGLYSSEIGPNNFYEKSPTPYRVIL
jgi:hypothetical protein